MWDSKQDPYKIGDPVGLTKIGGKVIGKHPEHSKEFINYWGFLSIGEKGLFPWIGNLASKKDSVLLAKKNIISSGPLLIRNKILLSNNELLNRSLTKWPQNKDAPGILKHIKDKAPRSAIGVDGKGTIYFIQVDGRLKDISNGMNIIELSGLLFYLGIEQGLNLDGGGSSAIYDAKAKKYLNVYEKERPIGVAIIIKERKNKYNLRKITNKKILDEYNFYPHDDFKIVKGKDISAKIIDSEDLPLKPLTLKYKDENKLNYLSKDESIKYAMSIEDGLIINPDDNLPASGLGKYVYSKDKILYISFLKQNEVYPSIEKKNGIENKSLANPGDGQILKTGEDQINEFRHSYFTGGDSIISAGWIYLLNGKIKCLDNHSGHYRPSWSYFRRFLYYLKYLNNIDLNDGLILSYETQHSPQYSLCWHLIPTD